MIEIKTPTLPESVADATVGVWHVQVGDSIEEGANLADLETDKVALELPAAKGGKVVTLHVEEGATVQTGDLLITIDETVKPEAKASSPSAPASAAASATAAPAALAPAAAAAPADPNKPIPINPAARRMMDDAGVSREAVSKQAASDATRRVSKEKMKAILSKMGGSIAREETRQPLPRIRQRIAQRLLSAQQNAAILTTFNEVNLKQIGELRKQAQTKFVETYGIKLGYMSLFVRASCIALADFPQVNASIDENDVIMRNFMDVSIAVSSPRGLVVPVLKNAQTLNLDEIEMAIADFANRAKTGGLTIEDMTGGTFSITNGGIFGSMLSTPIINPPQSAILGMHKIMERPIVEDGEIVIRPMMYLALSYDHRIIDGKEAVSFLVRVKELLENPALLFLGV